MHFRPFSFHRSSFWYDLLGSRLVEMSWKGSFLLLSAVPLCCNVICSVEKYSHPEHFVKFVMLAVKA